MNVATVAAPNQDERTMAALAHVLQLVGMWIAPLVIFLVKRESKFVSFHAMQALALQIVYMAVMMVFVVGWFATMFLTMATQVASKNTAPPVAIFLMFPVFWLGFMACWITLLALAIIYGIKAGHGEWAEYPVIGPVVRKMMKMGPGGTAM